jgi:hypothetical protein
MVKKNLLFFVAFCAALTAYGKKTPTQASFAGLENITGTWIIDTTVIKQTVDSVSTTKTYLAGDTAFTFVRRPLKIIISASEITFEYADWSNSGAYTVEGNRLLVDFPTHRAEYRYSIESGKLQLYYTAKYVIDGEHQAEEQCNFKGRAAQETEN